MSEAGERARLGRGAERGVQSPQLRTSTLRSASPVGVHRMCRREERRRCGLQYCGRAPCWLARDGRHPRLRVLICTESPMHAMRRLEYACAQLKSGCYGLAASLRCVHVLGFVTTASSRGVLVSAGVAAALLCVRGRCIGGRLASASPRVPGVGGSWSSSRGTAGSRPTNAEGRRRARSLPCPSPCSRHQRWRTAAVGASEATRPRRCHC